MTYEVIQAEISKKSFVPTKAKEKLAKYKSIGIDRGDADLTIKGYYKNITIGNLRKVCKKYGLVIARISDFISEIPDKNLNEIDSFLKNNQEYSYKFYPLFWGDVKKRVFKNKEAAKKVRNEFHPFCGGKSEINEKYKLFICAPKGDIAKRARTFTKAKPDDPIVIAVEKKRLLYGNFKDDNTPCIIVTAWDKEAQDEQIFNERLN